MKEKAKNSTQKESSGSVAEKCNCTTCKTSATRFGFCDEHYEQFKFGLIRKTGDRCSDYEKKYGHYLALKSKEKNFKKVA